MQFKEVTDTVNVYHISSVKAAQLSDRLEEKKLEKKEDRKEEMVENLNGRIVSRRRDNEIDNGI